MEWMLQVADEVDDAVDPHMRRGQMAAPDGDPIAYSPGVQAFVILSAAATVVDTSGGSSVSDDVTQIRKLAEADEVFDHEAGLLHTYQRGTTIDLIPPKAVTGTAQATDSALAQP